MCQGKVDGMKQENCFYEKVRMLYIFYFSVQKNKSFQLISCLGVFPYEWCTSLEKIRRAKELPSQEEFYDKLRGSELGNADYEHAQRVWNTFKCQSMRDYLEVKCFLNFCF